jgi:hypothetical protein
MANTRKDKAQFMERLKIVKAKLPPTYVLAIKTNNPDLADIKPTKFYSVMRGVSVDWRILEALERITKN